MSCAVTIRSAPVTSTNAAPMARAIGSSSWSGTVPRTSYAFTSAERSTSGQPSEVRADQRARRHDAQVSAAAGDRVAVAGRDGRGSTRPASRTASASASRSSACGIGAGNSPTCRSTSQPRGTVSRSGVLLAQVVGVRLGEGGERPDDGGQVGVGVGEGGDRRTAAAGPRAAPHKPHSALTTRDHSVRSPGPPVTASRAPLVSRGSRRRLGCVRNPRRPGRAPHGPARDRRGRGVRGELAPRAVPLHRTRGEQFDELVMDAVEEIEEHWSAELAGVEFAVEDVPSLTGRPPAEFDPDVVVDRGVPLGRLLPRRDPRRSGAGRSIVVYRRPVEARAVDRGRPRRPGVHGRRGAGRRVPGPRRRRDRPAALTLPR